MPGTTQDFKTLTVKELHPTFGAEIEGVNWDNLTDEGLKELEAAMAKYGVCVFRKTGLTDDAHVKFSYRLGELDTITRYLGPGRKLRYDHFELFDAGNLDQDNQIIDPDSPRAHQNRGNALFHCDSSFNPRRASYSLLRAVDIPPPAAGGPTEFADSRAAFDTLPEDLKQELLERDYVGANNMATSRKAGSPAFFRDVDPSQSPMAYHRILQRHEPSGRMNLYVGAHLHHIEGLDAGASASLIGRLLAHVTRPENTFSVRWNDPGDLVIWDNRCVLHRAGAGDFEGKYKRDLRRTTVHDDSPTAWGLNSKDMAMPGSEGWAAAMKAREEKAPAPAIKV